MDWYLAVWVCGALLTWAPLSGERAKRLMLSPEVYFAVILLWPLVWVVAAVSGLLGSLFRIGKWIVRGGVRK